MDTSILSRTIAITNTHVESDRSGEIEEKWGDVSINYTGYAKYDETTIPTQDSSVDAVEIRHTHLYANSSLQETINEINEYYKDRNLGPYEKVVFDPDWQSKINEESEN